MSLFGDFDGPAAKLGITDDCAEREHVLALRGLIGMQVLEHTLQRRHRVDFGLTERCDRLDPLCTQTQAVATIHKCAYQSRSLVSGCMSYAVTVVYLTMPSALPAAGVGSGCLERLSQDRRPWTCDVTEEKAAAVLA